VGQHQHLLVQMAGQEVIRFSQALLLLVVEVVVLMEFMRLAARQGVQVAGAQVQD
jgi:hypothetical protein